MRINEPGLQQIRWGLGVLEHVQVFRFPDSSPCGEEEAGPLLQLFREGVPCYGIDPELSAFSFRVPFPIKVAVRVEVEGEEYVAIVTIRNAASLPEGNVSVVATSEDDLMLYLEHSLELAYHPEYKVFLPMSLESGSRV